MQPFAHVTFPIQIVTATEKLRYSFSYPVGEYHIKVTELQLPATSPFLMNI